MTEKSKEVKICDSYCYYIETIAGTFWIAPVEKIVTVYILGINKKNLGIYTSPHDAARDVFYHSTGWERWDSLEQQLNSESLDAWEKGHPNFKSCC